MKEKTLASLEVVSALILTFIGGFIELYSLEVNGIFAGMQTGNLIQLFIYLTDKEYTLALYRLILIVTFFISCLIAEIIRYFLNKKGKNISPYILGLELLLILPLFFIKVEAYQDVPNTLNIVSDVFLTIFSAMQYMTFRELHGHSYATTMMTNLLSNLAKNLVSFITIKDKKKGKDCLEFFLILVSFILGSVVMYLIFINISSSEYLQLVLLIPFVLILITLLLNILINKNKLAK